MKDIQLPITRSFVSLVVDQKQASADLASGKVSRVPLGTIDFSCGKDLDQARANGGKIIWCAICIEKKLEEAISEYMFPPGGPANDKGRSFFITQILNSDSLSYSAKKGLVISMVNDDKLLKGKGKDKLSQILKKVMDYRNAFAHGEIAYYSQQGCVLTYWQGGRRSVVLEDDYWIEIEECFKIAHSLCDQIVDKLRSNNGMQSDSRTSGR